MPILDDGMAVSVKIAYINVNSIDTHELIPAVEGKKLHICGMTIICGQNQSITFKSGSTALGGPMLFNGGGIFDVFRIPPFSFCGTAAGEALNMTVTTAAQVSGSINYVEV